MVVQLRIVIGAPVNTVRYVQVTEARARQLMRLPALSAGLVTLDFRRAMYQRDANHDRGTVSAGSGRVDSKSVAALHKVAELSRRPGPPRRTGSLDNSTGQGISH